MDFRFTEEQVEIAEGVAAFLNGEATRDRLRVLVESPSDVEDLWPQIASLGVIGIMVPESAGGLGFGASEVVQIAEAAGRVALPDPLVETAGVAAPMLSLLEYEAVSDIVTGERRIAIFHDANPFVNIVHSRDLVLVSRRHRIDVVDAKSVGISSRDSIDPLRRLFSVTFDVSSSTPLAEGSEAEAAYEKMFALGSVFTSAELIGLAAGMINLAAEYAKEREQFGAAIGSFQAVKHHLANAFVKLEFARPLVYRAAATVDNNEGSRNLAISQAKIAASEAAIFAAETAIQIHGAMGYTYEVDLHFWIKRVWALAGLWGDASFHERRLDEALFSGAIALGPEHTFDMHCSKE